MTDDHITITVLIERKTGYREPQTLSRYQTERMPIVQGFACAHTVSPAGEMDLNDAGDPIDPCGWCELQGNDGTWQPVEVVQHALCDGWFTVDEIAAHIRQCC